MTYAYKSTGRPLQSSGFEKFRSNYLDVSNDPLYPFGYGLSYTTFAYGPVTLDRTSMTSDGRIVASVTLTNTGDRDGEEVVQLYIRDVVCSITRPVKELKGFQRVASSGANRAELISKSRCRCSNSGMPTSTMWPKRANSR